MKLKSLADLQSPTPIGVGLSTEQLADKTRSELQYARWNREDAIRSRLARAERLDAEREYFAKRYFGEVSPSAERKERSPNTDSVHEYLSGFVQ
jgi:hypothetical protein